MNTNEKQAFRAMAISPLDGRYHSKVEELGNYFSEFALVKNRIWVEVSWLKHLIKSLPQQEYLCDVTTEQYDALYSIVDNFDLNEFSIVKSLEDTIKHDVKSVEIYIGYKLDQLDLSDITSFVHFGCTSEDITNLAYANMLHGWYEGVFTPNHRTLYCAMNQLIDSTSSIPMTAHTHGQAATPTTVGKEIAVFRHRLSKSNDCIRNIDILGKLNGATGNYSAFTVAFPDIDWAALTKDFICCELGFSQNQVTTQIESHDYVCRILNELSIYHNILLDFANDMWQYIAMDYFKLAVVKDEVGSSTMPHKVNPINFENCKGNLNAASGLIFSMTANLSVSRMQRDLSDSSLQRSLGMIFGYSLQSMKELVVGLKKCEVNQQVIIDDLKNRWELLAEPIQTMLRKYGEADAYNRLKEMSRGKKMTKEMIDELISTFDFMSEEDKQILLNLTPLTYTGLATELAFIY